MKIKSFFLASACSFAIAAPAMALSDSSASESPGGGLEEVVVTAQKRSENVQQVPISIDVATGTALAKIGATNTLDLAFRTPSFQFGNVVGWVQPRIRGVGSSGQGPGIEQPVGIYVDGVYMADSSLGAMELNSVDRVEVLKGPQGTLFGRNATGGAINIITRDPKQDPSGEIELGYGNFKTAHGKIYATTGLAPNLAIDIAYTGTLQGKGYGINIPTGQGVNRDNNNHAVRSKVLWTPTQTTELRLSVDYAMLDGSGNASREFPGELPLLPVPFPASGGPWDTNNEKPYHQKLHNEGVSLRVDQDIDFAKIVSITAYRHSGLKFNLDDDYTPIVALPVYYDIRDKQFSQELQLVSGKDSSIQYVGGLYYFDHDSHSLHNDFYPTGPLLPAFGGLSQVLLNGSIVTRSYAAFAQATAPLTSSTKFTAGLRYTIDKSRLSGAQVGILPDGTNVGSILPPGTVVPRSNTFKKLTWRFALDQTINPDILAYASYNRGFKSGGFTQAQMNIPAFAPETLDAYEVGLKSELLDRRIRLNLAGFYYNYKDMQIATLRNFTVVFINGARGKLYGADMDGEIVITPRLHLTASAILEHAKFASFPNAPFNYPVASGGNLPTPADASGNQIPFTPKFSSSIGLSYTMPVASGDVTMNVDWQHNSGFYGEADNLRRQPAFELVNANIKWESAGGWSIGFWGKNLTNEAVQQLVVTGALYSAVDYRPPRTYGGTIGVKF